VYLGIEIGGTKLQLGVGEGDGKLLGLWRGTVDPTAGSEGIRRQIVNALPELLSQCGLARCHLHGVGIGFGGPVDDATHTVIKSHQIAGWDGFPLADWISDVIGVPAVLGNDADVAGLAEALHGAGKGLSPIFYITIGSGIGGGLIIDGEIYRGCGRGAAEIGHLHIGSWLGIAIHLEGVASGWAIGAQMGKVKYKKGLRFDNYTAERVAEAAHQDDEDAQLVIDEALTCLAEGLCNVIALLCPRRIVIGGGVSLMGQHLFFKPLRDKMNDRIFPPFAGMTDIVPAALGEEVVVHGAIALARKTWK
jgi:glucokinase